MKVLVVDDELMIREVIKEYCLAEKYEVVEAVDGNDALIKLSNNTFDVMILDIMMPKMDGFTLLKSLDSSLRVPTIVLSARGEEYDKLLGFDLGIDDYLTKPFSPKELIARIKALTNRTSNNIDIYKLGSLEINFSSHYIKIDNNIINVTPKEFEILSYLIMNGSLH